MKETWESRETGSELKSTTKKKEKKNYGFMRQTRERERERGKKKLKKTFQPGQPVSPPPPRFSLDPFHVILTAPEQPRL